MLGGSIMAKFEPGRAMPANFLYAQSLFPNQTGPGAKEGEERTGYMYYPQPLYEAEYKSSSGHITKAAEMTHSSKFSSPLESNNRTSTSSSIDGRQNAWPHRFREHLNETYDSSSNRRKLPGPGNHLYSAAPPISEPNAPRSTLKDLTIPNAYPLPRTEGYILQSIIEDPFHQSEHSRTGQENKPSPSMDFTKLDYRSQAGSSISRASTRDQESRISESAFSTPGTSVTGSNATPSIVGTMDGSSDSDGEVEYSLARLESRKMEIVERLMDYFLECFEMRTITMPLTQKTCQTDKPGSPDGDTQGISQTGRPSTGSKSRGNKRNRHDDSNRQGSQDINDDRSRTGAVKASRRELDTTLLFACPYFKRCPPKYRRCRSCLGPGWQSLHRLK
jgi:hypothetical protein